MKRAKVQLTDYPNFLDKAKSYISKQENTWFLDSCGISAALNINRYDWVIAFGIKECIAENAPQSKLNAFIDKHLNHWVFGMLSYELKSNTPSKTDNIQAPIAVCCVPETVIVKEHNADQIQVFSFASPSFVIDEILKEEPFLLKERYLSGSVICSESPDEYKRKIQQIKNDIVNGAYYELNYCVTFEKHGKIEPFALFEQNKMNYPAPFSAYLKWGHQHLLCHSPERFINTQQDQIYAQPIKGTTAITNNAKVNDQNLEMLRNSEKEKAENVMIVDLTRHDLAKHCTTGSVQVPELFGIYPYGSVYQMVSTIKGTLIDQKNGFNALLSSFPMGSMTGAPKIAAINAISNLENRPRGWYSGSLFYKTPDGNIDSNVIIRSIRYNAKNEFAAYSAGGAITYDSDPQAEWEEIQLKAKKFLL